ncbi:MAG: GOLPH3/VPS74 family protein, partial [Candidatus Kariarchaeaceae archaeon]
YWIKTLRRKIKDPEQLLLDSLVKRGILKSETKNILGIIPSKRYFYTKPNTREIIRTNICRVIQEKEESDYRTLALLSLVYTTNCETEIFTKQELETYLHNIRNIVSSDEIGQSITAAINSTVEALMSNLILTQTY